MKVHWKAKSRFGIATGIHSNRRRNRRSAVIYSSKTMTDTKICISKKSLRLKQSMKRKLQVTFPLVREQYKSKRVSDLNLVLKRIHNVSVKGYRMMNLMCLETHINNVLKHVLQCDKGKELLLKDGNIVTIDTELRTQGLASILLVRCMGCKNAIKLETSPKLKANNKTNGKYDINVRAVWGSIVTGNGASHLKEVMSTMDAPSLSQPAFGKIEAEIGSWWQNISRDELLAAGAEERRLAVENNRFHHGVPAITVIADGGWSKRTHKHSYNAFGGVAIIIGKETGKILHIGIRNKYCYICSHAHNMQQKVTDHVCYKNWNQNSQAMEADIILEGFKDAEKTHGLRYMWLVGDGDSSMYKRIREEVPIWGSEVEKIECANHMCKCLRTNLEKLVDNNPHYKGKNNLTKAVRIRLVSAVRCAIRMRSKEDNKHEAAIKLEKDIRNSVHHIFGKHNNCSDFCKQNKDIHSGNLHSPDDINRTHDEPSEVCSETSLLWQEGSSIKEQELSRYSTGLDYCDLKSDMLNDISILLDRVASKSRRLIQNTTTNLAECWMHMRSKFDGGKVYNLCNRGSWFTRCYGGCLRMNVGPKWSPLVWKKSTSSVPGTTSTSCIQKGKDSCFIPISLKNQQRHMPIDGKGKWRPSEKTQVRKPAVHMDQKFWTLKMMFPVLLCHPEHQLM